MKTHRTTRVGVFSAVVCAGILAAASFSFDFITSARSLHVSVATFTTAFKTDTSDLTQPAQYYRSGTAFSTLSNPQSFKPVSQIDYQVTEEQETTSEFLSLPDISTQQAFIETPSPTPFSEKTVTQPVQQEKTGLDAEKIFMLINQYRVSKNLPELQKDQRLCSLATSRAPEIAGEVASGTMHSGLAKHNLAYKNSENIISMRSEEDAVAWWVNDYIHRVTIEGSAIYSCVSCFGNECAQEFSSLEQ